MAPTACEPSHKPRATRWGTMPCAPGCELAASARSVPAPSARVLPKPTRTSSWQLKTYCSVSLRPHAPIRCGGDITYLPLLGGRWYYVATWRHDTGSRRVVGWHPAAQIPTELVLTALEQTLTLRQPAPGLLIHAKRSSQYTSQACRQRIADAGAQASFSRPGNPYENAG